MMSIKYLLTIIIIVLVLFSSCEQYFGISKNPNFIIILTDDQQFDAAGFSDNLVIKTPNMDRMASQAMNFKEAHVAFSLCSPSRAAILTGRYGISNGVLGLGSSLNPDEVSFLSILKERGYKTGHFGKWHIGQTPGELGFDTYDYFTSNGKYYGRRFINNSDTLYPQIHCDQFAVSRTVEFLEKASKEDTPFIAFLCTQTPHMNGELVWDAKEETKDMYDVGKMPVPINSLDSLVNKPPYLKNVRNRTQAKAYGYPDSLSIQKHTRDYYAVITELDIFLGQLFKKVEDLKLLENTYIVFMSDNGWMLGDHGFTSKVLPYQPSTHIPFWILGPGIKPSINNSMVTNLDVFPTILSIAEIDIPINLHGKDLQPLLSMKKESVRELLIYEGLGIYGNSQYNLSVIDQDFLYIETYFDKSLEEVVFQELYNRKSDPEEMNNLAQDNASKMLVDIYHNQINSFKEKNIKADNSF